MADTKLNIIVAVKDSASSALGGIAARMRGLGGGGGGSSPGARAIGSIGAGAGSAFTGVAARMAALAGGLISIGAAAKVMHDSMDKASEFEDIQTSFVTLLGSTGAAQKRMDELAKFAAVTPFDIPGVARASKTLETLTRGALSTGSGLTLVGDVAASTGTQFDEMAVTIGRAYDGLTSGRAVGESLARLQELGTLSGATRGKLEQMQASGKKGAEVWGLLAAELSKFGGEMDRRSQTFSGKMSNMKDAWDSLQRAFGEPVINALKPLLDDLGAWFEKMKPAAAEFGRDVAGAIELIRKAFGDGTLMEKIGASMRVVFDNAAGYLGNSLKQAFRMALATLYGGVAGIGDMLASGLLGDGKISLDGYGEAFQRQTEKAAEFLGAEEPPSLAKWISSTKNELRDIWGNMPPVTVAPDSGPGARAQIAETPTLGGKIGKVETDALAKVGLFAGGSSPALNYARRTADGVDRMARGIDKLVKTISKPATSGAAEFA